MALKLKCSNVMCTTNIDFTRKLVKLGPRLFCKRECAEAYQQQHAIFVHAAEGRPTMGRRPTSEKKWFEADG